MGYARLHFPNNGTVLMTHLLYDVVGVLTGTFTNTNQLQTATQSLSQIVNTQNSNWSFLYPASHGIKGANTSWVLSAPCVNAAKTKYIRLTNMANANVPSAGTANSVNYDVTFLNSNLTAGLVMQSATAASSATALTNATWLATAITNTGTAFTSNFIYLHWSQRHCLIYGGMGSDLAKGFIASFEHQETGITTTRGTAPVVHLVYASSNGTWDSTATAPGSPAYSGKQNVCQVLNHFAVSTATTTGLYNVLSNINSQQNDMPLISDAASGAFPATTTKNSSGALARQVQPLYWHQHHIGVPHQYVSQLSNVYRTAPSMGQEGDSVTIGNDTYVYLPTTYNAYNLLVRRA